ncbi:MAG: hypothetical protein RIS56_2635 [Verrucomicrobiota bacterium]
MTRAIWPNFETASSLSSGSVQRKSSKLVSVSAFVGRTSTQATCFSKAWFGLYFESIVLICSS